MMFDKHFEAVLADCEEGKRVHYKIRYQVYCMEAGYEDSSAFVGDEEKDEWDKHSAHFLIRSKLTGEWIAAMRLILPGAKGSHPVFQFCDIDGSVANRTHGSTTGEISRLCIVNSFRRKLTTGRAEMERSCPDQQGFTAHAQLRDRCKEPLIVLGLFRAAAQYSREHGIPYWYFLTTSALARMLKRMNVHMVKAGGSCMHNGERHPFLIDLRDAVERARRGSGVIAQMLDNQVGYVPYSQLPKDTDQGSSPFLQPYAA
ncbi:MAG: PEP-CTERM/exosortase system-associated acyltransferase [Gammaproteobacteria bacterium]